jgi:hypothetical protein
MHRLSSIGWDRALCVAPAMRRRPEESGRLIAARSASQVAVAVRLAAGPELPAGELTGDAVADRAQFGPAVAGAVAAVQERLVADVPGLGETVGAGGRGDPAGVRGDQPGSRPPAAQA